MDTLSVSLSSSSSSSSSSLVPAHFHGLNVPRAVHPYLAFGRSKALTTVTPTATQGNRLGLHKTNCHTYPNASFNKPSPTHFAGTHMRTDPFVRQPGLSQIHIPPICVLQGTEDSTIPEVKSATEGQVITCKAAVAWAAGEPLKIEEIQVAPPQAMEVRIKICYTSLCRTDLIFWQAKGQTPLFPRIFGHEAAGIVESVGEGVTDLKVGDHVLPVFTGECGECKHCKSEESNMCDLLRINTERVGMISDGKSRFSIGGKPIHHFLGTSTFSEYTVAHVGCVAKINPAAPLSKACILSCGVSTGMGATLNVGKPKKGSTVAIFGLGGVGLAAAEGARIAGASRIIGVDFNPGKFEKAKQFGVTEYVNPKEHQKPVQQVIADMTDGGVDCSVECTGNVNAMIQAFESCHDGWGVAVLVGVPSSDAVFATNPVNILNERTLKGTFFGNYKTKSDLPGLVEKYLNKELELDKFITSEIPFAEINKAFQLMIEGDGLRCVMKVQDD